MSRAGVEQRARATFRDHFAGEPDGVAMAPGRVNLIGDHTDYTEGLVFPAALNLRTAVAYRRTEEPRLRGTSEAFHDHVVVALEETTARGWAAYLTGVTAALRDHGVPLGGARGGLDLAVASDVPRGSGLSSSAALEVAVLRAFRDSHDLDLDDVTIAKLGRHAENRYVGVPSGIMDQFAASVPQPGEAILLDCRSLEYDVVPIPAGWTFVVIDSGVGRSLAGSAYEQRVRECTEAARILGVPTLRDATPRDLDRLDGILLERARHVVTENERVRNAAHALRTNDPQAFGRLMTESHHSLRDDYHVSSETLDRIVATALATRGCHGARLTGAGFGGCCVALVESEHKEAFARELERAVEGCRAIAELGAP